MWVKLQRGTWFIEALGEHLERCREAGLQLVVHLAAALGAHGGAVAARLLGSTSSSCSMLGTATSAGAPESRSDSQATIPWGLHSAAGTCAARAAMARHSCVRTGPAPPPCWSSSPTSDSRKLGTALAGSSSKSLCTYTRRRRSFGEIIIPAALLPGFTCVARGDVQEGMCGPLKDWEGALLQELCAVTRGAAVAQDSMLCTWRGYLGPQSLRRK